MLFLLKPLMISIQSVGSKEIVVVEYSFTDNIGTPISVSLFLWKFDTSSKTRNENDKNTNFMMGNIRKMLNK